MLEQTIQCEVEAVSQIPRFVWCQDSKNMTSQPMASAMLLLLSTIVLSLCILENGTYLTTRSKD